MNASIVAGAVLGLSVALPFGPVSLICVQRSIEKGYGYGIMSGAGAATAHGIFAAAALFAQSMVTTELARWDTPIRLFSATLLILLGIRTLLRSRRPAPPSSRGSLPAAFGSSFALALSNPMSILPYLAVASASGAAKTTNTLSTTFVPGVMAGAIAWYFVLTGGASLFRTGAPDRVIRPLNRIAGSMLILFGLWLGWGSLSRLQ